MTDYKMNDERSEKPLSTADMVRAAEGAPSQPAPRTNEERQAVSLLNSEVEADFRSRVLGRAIAGLAWGKVQQLVNGAR